MKHGDLVVWKPKRPRRGSYGAAWGMAPVVVKILSGPDADGIYCCSAVNENDLPTKRARSRISANALFPVSEAT